MKIQHFYFTYCTCKFDFFECTILTLGWLQNVLEMNPLRWVHFTQSYYIKNVIMKQHWKNEKIFFVCRKSARTKKAKQKGNSHTLISIAWTKMIWIRDFFGFGKIIEHNLVDILSKIITTSLNKVVHETKQRKAIK